MVVQARLGHNPYSQHLGETRASDGSSLGAAAGEAAGQVWAGAES